MFLKEKKPLLSMSAVLVASSLLWACAGDTGGEEGAENANLVEDDFVSDGAAGASLEIDVLNRFFTGGRSGFFVRARDAQGQPLESLRVVCDTEPGLIILDPSSGNGLTDQFGNFSGVLSGETPGSFAIECRGPFGTNLIDQATSQLVTQVVD